MPLNLLQTVQNLVRRRKSDKQEKGGVRDGGIAAPAEGDVGISCSGPPTGGRTGKLSLQRNDSSSGTDSMGGYRNAGARCNARGEVEEKFEAVVVVSGEWRETKEVIFKR